MGLNATARASLYIYNDESDIDVLAEAINEAGKIFAWNWFGEIVTGLEDLYKEVILDHYRSPRNKGELPTPPAIMEEGFNPLWAMMWKSMWSSKTK